MAFLTGLARPFAAVIAIGAVWTASLPAWAGDPENSGELRPLGSWVVARVIDGDTIDLNDGRRIRLVGIQSPELRNRAGEYQPMAFAEEAKNHLAKLAGGKSVTVYTGKNRHDRHGRILAHLVTIDDGVWLQDEMLKAGLAHVYTFPDNPMLAGEMLATEQKAREKNIGIWSRENYRVIDQSQAGKFINTFRLVEGTVLSAQRVKNRIYLNFGPDWKTDFTVLVDDRYLDGFIQRGPELLALEGKKIRVRGWLRRENGPMIAATHPEQLELVD